MTRRFVIVCEARADFETASELADRVLCESVDWLQEEDLDYQRSWLHHTTTGESLTWTGIKHLARNAGITIQGYFDNQPGAADAQLARRAILYLLTTFPDLDAILLIRDQDNQPERLNGLEQARNHDYSGKAIVIGVAVVERESWVICGFEPKNNEERDQLETERRRLGFNPQFKSHELTACSDDTAVRSPKRVLRQLAGGVRERERLCWTETSLDVLRKRGDKNGLAVYLREVRDRLAPLIGHVPM